MEKGEETSEKYKDRGKVMVQSRHEQLRINVFWKVSTREIVPQSSRYWDKAVELFYFICNIEETRLVRTRGSVMA